MARMILEDEIDFSAYEQETECRVLVRKASAFADDLDAAFEPSKRVRAPAMRSTKFGNAIEFRPGEVTVWAGYNGHRKSMFVGQVALDLCSQSQRTLMLSLEMPPRDTLSRACQQACATDLPSKQRRKEFMTWTDGKLWIFDYIGKLVPQRCLAVLRYFADELQGQHVFIDSFMKVVESEEIMDQQKAMVGALCEVAKETNLHVHLLAHCRKPGGGNEDKPPTKYDIKGSGSISDQAHNVILLWENKAKRAEADKKEPSPMVMGQPDFLVTLDKQRNGRVEGKFGLSFDMRTLRFCDDAMSAVEPYDMEAA